MISQIRPKNYPFDDLAKFAIDCKHIVTFFKNHHALNHVLKEKQKQNSLQAVKIITKH